MAYIHELPDWPHLTWEARSVLARLASVRHKQGLLHGRMLGLGFDLQTEAAVSTLTDEIVRSCAIEGERLDTDEVRSSLARRMGLPTAGLPTPSREVEGIVAVMLDATTHCDVPLTAERLFGWHAALFPTGRSGAERITVGAWRTPAAGPMRVVSGMLGAEQVHFVAPAAERVAGEMDRFLAWFNSEREQEHEITAAVAHFWFVTVHPFDDGNGRIARVIADMALARADRMAQRFYSMSKRIESERKHYYIQLESAQRGSTDITAWIAWFLGCLERAIDAADETRSRVLYKARVWQSIAGRRINDRQRLVLNRMLDDWQGNMTSSKYAKLCACSADSALRDIRQLAEWGALVENAGGGRSTSYRLREAPDRGEEAQARRSDP